LEVLMVPIFFFFFCRLRHFFVSLHKTKEFVTLNLSNYFICYHKIILCCSCTIHKSFAPLPNAQNQYVVVRHSHDEGINMFCMWLALHKICGA
jgi:hypothetical protein